MEYRVNWWRNTSLGCTEDHRGIIKNNNTINDLQEDSTYSIQVTSCIADSCISANTTGVTMQAGEFLIINESFVKQFKF